jgi:hypothetical protein
MSKIYQYFPSVGKWLSEFGPGDLVSLLALSAACFAIWQTHRNSKSVAPLTQLQIAQVEAQAAVAKSAEVSARFAKSGRFYYLKIFNLGPCAALNVNAELLEGSELVGDDEINVKLPMSRMEPQDGISLPAPITFDSPRKLKIRLIWDDDRKLGNEKILELAW